MKTTLTLFNTILISACLTLAADRSAALGNNFSGYDYNDGLNQYIGLGYFSGKNDKNEGLEYVYLGAFDSHHVKASVTNVSAIDYSDDTSPFTGFSLSYGYGLDQVLSPYLGAGFLAGRERTYYRECQHTYPEPCEDEKDYFTLLYPELGIMFRNDAIVVSVFARRYFDTDEDSSPFNAIGFNFLWSINNWWGFY